MINKSIGVSNENTDEDYDSQIKQKRAWRKLNGAWGKRVCKWFRTCLVYVYVINVQNNIHISLKLTGTDWKECGASDRAAVEPGTSWMVPGESGVQHHRLRWLWRISAAISISLPTRDLPLFHYLYSHYIDIYIYIYSYMVYSKLHKVKRSHIIKYILSNSFTFQKSNTWHNIYMHIYVCLASKYNNSHVDYIP